MQSQKHRTHISVDYAPLGDSGLNGLNLGLSFDPTNVGARTLAFRSFDNHLYSLYDRSRTSGEHLQLGLVVWLFDFDMDYLTFPSVEDVLITLLKLDKKYRNGDDGGTLGLALIMPEESCIFVPRCVELVVKHRPCVTTFWLQEPPGMAWDKFMLRAMKLDPDEVTNGPKNLALNIPGALHQTTQVFFSRIWKYIAPHITRLQVLGATLPPLLLTRDTEEYKFPKVKQLMYRVWDDCQLKELCDVLHHCFPALARLDIALDPKNWDHVGRREQATFAPVKPNIFSPGVWHPGTEIVELLGYESALPSAEGVETQDNPSVQGSQSEPNTKGLIFSLHIYMPGGNGTAIVSPEEVLMKLGYGRNDGVKYYYYYF